MSLYAMIDPGHYVHGYTQSHAAAVSMTANSRNCPETPPEFYRRPVLIRSDAYGLILCSPVDWARLGRPGPYFPADGLPIVELGYQDYYAVRLPVTGIRYIQWPNRLYPVAIGREA